MLFHGPRGRGATDALLMDFAKRCGQGYGEAWTGILFRNTTGQLDDIVKRSKKWFYRLTAAPKFKESRVDYSWHWPTGETLLLRHFDKPEDYWNYHGHEYPWIGWDELTNWPTSEGYEMMMACSRSSTVGVKRRYRATTNPYGKGHNWIKARFIDAGEPMQVVCETVEVDGRKITRERTHIFGSYLENAALLAATPDYAASMAMQAGSEARRRAWLSGDWNIVAGGMFDDLWSKRPPVIRPFAVPHNWYVDRSFDWGSSAPYAIGFWAESNGEEVKGADGTTLRLPRGSLVMVGEIYGWNGKPNEGIRHGNAEIAKRTLEAAMQMGFGQRCRPGPADSAIYAVTNGTSIADEMARVGCKWIPAAKGPGSRVAGWQKMRDMIEAWVNQDPERPWLVFFDTCRHAIRTLPALPRDDRDPDDVDTDAEDHVGDLCRYRVSVLQRTGGSSQLAGV